VARVSFFFRDVRFSLAWWAYTFPVTSAAIATAVYASAMTSALNQALAVGMSGVPSVTDDGVLATTVFRAFVRRDLLPNDVSIAIRQDPQAPPHLQRRPQGGVGDEQRQQQRAAHPDGVRPRQSQSRTVACPARLPVGGLPVQLFGPFCW
jgi:hypothetical protein